MYKIGIKVKQTFSEGSTHALCKKVSVFGVFLVRVFPHSEGIRRDTDYLAVFSANARKHGPEKLQIRTLFT